MTACKPDVNLRSECFSQELILWTSMSETHAVAHKAMLSCLNRFGCHGLFTSSFLLHLQMMFSLVLFFVRIQVLFLTINTHQNCIALLQLLYVAFLVSPHHPATEKEIKMEYHTQGLTCVMGIEEAQMSQYKHSNLLSKQTLNYRLLTLQRSIR